jgi:hypothetical protein
MTLLTVVVKQNVRVTLLDTGHSDILLEQKTVQMQLH